MGIAVQGYCPLGKGAALCNATVAAIARAHGRSAAQVLLRWSLQHGVITIPKSTNPAHVRDNVACLDGGWSLNAGDMGALDGLHQGLRVTWDPTDVP